jgi:hypothetical protein
MARAKHTYNTGKCTCGKDHDQLSHIVAAVIIGVENGALEADSPWDVGDLVAQAAEDVGWVKAGDELEDLRSLVGDITGIDSIDLGDPKPGEGFHAPVSNPEGEALTPQNMLVSVDENFMYIGKTNNDALRQKDSSVEVIFTVFLTPEVKKALIREMTNSLPTEEDSE